MALLIAQAHTSHVAIELATHDEVAQGQLTHDLRAAVLDRLRRDHVPGEPGGHEHPAQAHGRCKALAGRADVEDPLGGETLKRSDGDSVIAVLRVEVVLDDQPLTALDPLDQRDASLAAEHTAARELVGRGHQDSRHLGSSSACTHSPSSSTGTATVRRPACSAIRRCTCQPGSSIAIASTP